MSITIWPVTPDGRRSNSWDQQTRWRVYATRGWQPLSGVMPRDDAHAEIMRLRAEPKR